MSNIIEKLSNNMLPSYTPNVTTSFYDVVNMDISGSMHDVAFVPRETKRKTMGKANRKLLDQKKKLRPNDYLAVVAYHNFATVCCRFLNVSKNYRYIVQAMNQAMSLDSGGTAIYTGLHEASNIIAQIPTGTHCQPRILAYSDGYDSSEGDAIRISNRLKKQGVIIETFGVAISPSEVDESFLKKLATKDSNGFIHYRFLGDADSIQTTFEEIALGTLTVD